MDQRLIAVFPHLRRFSGKHADTELAQVLASDDDTIAQRL
jgi:hypothetical protein